jgi:hypothetical protein
MLVAAALIALSRLMGPLLACGLMGLILLLLALLITARLRSRPVAPPPRALTPDELAFSIGFALANAAPVDSSNMAVVQVKAE